MLVKLTKELENWNRDRINNQNISHKEGQGYFHDLSLQSD